MAYRNGTYVAFHANGTNIPIDSDIKYYNLMKAWSEKSDDCFTMINSHEKASAVRDSSSKETLKRSLIDRLNNSKNVVLLLGKTTKFDDDWIPFEIAYAVDKCKLPFIITYLEYGESFQFPSNYSEMWPLALKHRIEEGKVSAIHIPFKKLPLNAAITQFNLKNLPSGSRQIYTNKAYENWGY